MVENCTKFLGQYLFNIMLGNFMNKMLNNYYLDLIIPSPLTGQGTWAAFQLDYHHKKSPYIAVGGYLDMFVNGKLLYNGDNFCNDAVPLEEMDFINSDTFS